MKNMIIEFYAGDFYNIQDNKNLDISFIPSLMQRRLSSIDKCVLSVLKESFTDDVEYIVFSSQYGEVERLDKIINQYQTQSEVSPNVFAGSVHNYAVGFFLQNIKKSIPYTALSSTENTIEAGIVASVISKYNKVAFCYTDIIENQVKAFCIIISKKFNYGYSKYKLLFKNTSNTINNYDNYIKFFQGNISKISSNMFEIERVENDK